jgi:hypothetical protein
MPATKTPSDSGPLSAISMILLTPSQEVAGTAMPSQCHPSRIARGVQWPARSQKKHCQATIQYTGRPVPAPSRPTARGRVPALPQLLSPSSSTGVRSGPQPPPVARPAGFVSIPWERSRKRFRSTNPEGGDWLAHGHGENAIGEVSRPLGHCCANAARNRPFSFKVLTDSKSPFD